MSMKRFMCYVTVLFVAIIGTAYAVGCMTPKQASELRATMDQGTSRVHELNAQIEDFKVDLRALVAKGETDPDAADLAAQFVSIINSTTEERDKWLDVLTQAKDKLDSHEEGWNLAQTAVDTLAVFVPMAAVGGTLLRKARAAATGHAAAFEGVVRAMAQGGGPKDGPAARRAMKMIPGLKDRVTDMRVEIGDKVRTTEPAPAVV